MHLLSFLTLATCAACAIGDRRAYRLPLVVLPPTLRWNSTNTITVTPLIINNYKEVEAEFRVEDSKGVIYVRDDLIWKAGIANNKHFLLTAPSSTVSSLPHELKIRLLLKGGHKPFETMTSTDLRVVHVFSDKAHYKNGETITIRALPLNVHNELYTKPIELVLINPGRFELLRRRASSSNGRFVQATMRLPQHLQYGEWRIEARPVDSHEAAGTVYFNVHDYVLPNFEVAIIVDQETTDVKKVPVTVKARYTHTVLVEGSLTLYCFNKSMLVWETDYLVNSVHYRTLTLPNSSLLTRFDLFPLFVCSFVTVLSVTASPSDPSTLHARLLSSTHVDHILNVLSGKLRVREFLCEFARPFVDDSEDETFVEGPHEDFLSPHKKCSPISTMDQSSVFLTPPQSPSHSTLGDDESCPVGWPVTPERGAHSAPVSTIPIGLHPEVAALDPSPERPENRASRRRAAELAAIYDRGAAALRVVSESTGDFLPLPPPYHLLPNTPYFRNAPIAPPLLKPPVPPPATQRIINRYLNSMKVMDNLHEEEVQSLTCFNFNRTIGCCPYTMPEKAPLQLKKTADRDDKIDDNWSIWSTVNDLENPNLTNSPLDKNKNER